MTLALCCHCQKASASLLVAARPRTKLANMNQAVVLKLNRFPRS